MRAWAAGSSFPGGRSCNEDTVSYTEINGCFVAIVADGLGGHGGGAEASAAAAQSFAEGFRKKPEISEDNLFRLVGEANHRIMKLQTAKCRMKSTFVALVCDESRMAFVHVGDSRLYWFHEDELRFRTIDHSVSQMAALAGTISEREIRYHEDRNKVLRALGGNELVRPDITIMDRKPGSSAFLLCTDGFWEHIWEEEMQAELVKADSPEGWLNGMLARIGRRLNQKSDNLSAVAAFIQG